MTRILVAVRRLSHWDAILPLLPWLEDAGVEFHGLKPGSWSPRRSLAELALRSGFGPPRVRFRRRPGDADSALLVGTSDDLELLLRLGRERPFLAVPRLPLPVALLSSPPAALAAVARVSAAGPIGALLSAQSAYAHPALSARTGGLPFAVTGLPELDRPPQGPPRSCFVVIHPGDFELERSRSRERDPQQLPHRELLEQVLLPLVASGQGVELRSAAYPGPEQDAPLLARLVQQIEARRTLAPRRIAVCEGPGWNDVADAQAVLVFRGEDLWKALAAGAQRAWYLSFARSLPDGELGGERVLPQATLRDAASYRRFIAEKGWSQPQPEVAELADTLHAPSDGHASERVAQAILAFTLCAS